MFGKGCFDACPEGLLVSGGSCYQPTQQNCTDNGYAYLIKASSYDSNLYFDYCSDFAAIGSYAVQTKNNGTWVSTGVLDFQCQGGYIQNTFCRLL